MKIFNKLNCQVSLIRNYLKPLISFFSKNYFHIIVCLFVIILIFLRNLSNEWRPIINLPATTLNYYWDILINIGISYIAGFFFYLLIVYIPDQRRRKNVEVSLKIHFAAIYRNACVYLDETFIAFDFEFDETTNLQQTFVTSNSDKDPYKILSNSIAKSDFFYYYEEPYKNRFEIILEASDNILKNKCKLVPYIAYMNREELNCYSILEDIRIFDQIHKLSSIGYYFFDTLDEILELIKVSGKTLKWAHRYKAEYRNMKKELLAQ